MNMLIINQFSNSYTPQVTQPPLQKNAIGLQADTISFKAHLGVERFLENSLGRLIHQSGIYRDCQTKCFVLDYIGSHLLDSEKTIKMWAGACSTGEDVFSYRMLLNDKCGYKLQITGFDVSQKCIDIANKGKLLMLKSYDKEQRYLHEDAFLCFDGIPLDCVRTQFLERFREYFNVLDEKFPKKSLLERLMSPKDLLTPSNGIQYKYVQLKSEKVPEFKFVQCDILNLDKMGKDEKVHVISFPNALFHLVCKRNVCGERVLRNDAVEIFEQVVQQVKQHLQPGGLFVLGENETVQMRNSRLVPFVLNRMGFTGFNATDYHPSNVWRLNKINANPQF